MNLIKAFAIGCLQSLSLATLLAGQAAMAAWPEKPMRMVVPFTPGGAADLMTRSLSAKMQDSMGQPVVLDYRGGAGGILASEMVATAPADGYTMLFGTVGTHAINPGLYAKLSYDPVKQFTPVSITHAIPRVLVVNPAIPARTVGELIAHGKANPRTLSFGSAGTGSTSHLAGELFKAMAGVDMTHIPYKGSAPAVADLLTGRISMAFDSVTVYAGHIKSGKVRALGVTSLQRIGALPAVPTISESGLSGFEVANWAGVFLPAGVSRDIVTRLNTEVRKAMADAESRAQLVANGIEPLSSSPEEFAAILRADISKWAKVIKASGATAE
jgi:tripartite-type tricarboxylate transporter receptor subunit TctC